MEGLLSSIVTKRHLDPRYHELVLPPSKPKTAQTQFSPSTQFHTLGITEVHIVKRVKPLADKATTGQKITTQQSIKTQKQTPVSLALNILTISNMYSLDDYSKSSVAI